jgi:hypothetical protein
VRSLALVAVAGCAGMSLEQAPAEIRWTYCRDHPVGCRDESPKITALGDGCYEVNNRIYECGYDDVPGKQLRCAPDSWVPWQWLRPTSDLSEAQLDSGLSTRIIDVSQKTIGRCVSLWNERRIAACTHAAVTARRRPPAVIVADAREGDDLSRFVDAAQFLLDTSTPLEISNDIALEILRSGKDRVMLVGELCDDGRHLSTRTIRRSTGFASLDRVIAEEWLPGLHTARPPDEPACAVVAVIVWKIDYFFPLPCN